MKQRDVRLFLYDIIEATNNVQVFTRQKSLKDYQENLLLRSAVERQFEIIGEALSQALRTSPELEQRFSHARRIIGLRNRLIHGYALVDNDIVWDTLQTDLPLLRSEAEILLNRLEPNI